GLPLDAVGLDFYHLAAYVRKTRRAVYGEEDPQEPPAPGHAWAAGLLHTAKHDGYEALDEALCGWPEGLRGAKRQAGRALFGEAFAHPRLTLFPPGTSEHELLPAARREAMAMNSPNTLIEYGVPIEADLMVTPPDANELELEPGHPGLGDEGYIRRRKELFALCRKHRLERLGPPLIEYTPEETRIWREVSPKLDELHVKHASQIYVQAKRELAITRDEIPQLRLLSERVQRETNMHLVPAEGALPYRTFYEYIAQRGFPVTQFIRHGSHPEFTPE